MDEHFKGLGISREDKKSNGDRQICARKKATDYLGIEDGR